MEEEDIIEQPTWAEWKILKNISVNREKAPTYKKIWAERIHEISSNPTFNKAISIILNNNIATSKSWVGNCHVITIDIKKLDKFIEETDVYLEFKSYVYNKELLVVGV